MSGQGASGSSDAPSSSALPKAIGSLAKKQVDVTRQGTQKLKFVPTLPPRRKKDGEVKPEPAPSTIPVPPSGRGRGRGRGEGRGPGPRPSIEMTASGPFAMGPALAGSSTRRSVPRSNFVPIAISDRNSATSPLGAGLSGTRAPSLKKEKEPDSTRVQVDDEDVYSDPDDGVEIVDMEDVRQMDWMAPESLKREKNDSKRREAHIKLEHLKTTGKGRQTTEVMDTDETTASGEVNLANALDLSESEQEEELEDLIEDFALKVDEGQDTDIRQERLYFFQFPAPFPTFLPKSSAPSDAMPIDVDVPAPIEYPTSSPKKVPFAADVKLSSATSSRPTSITPDTVSNSKEKPTALDGVIGQLEVYKSGAVKMRLENGIVLDVSAATQPSFLQHAVHLDMEKKRLNVLGEVNKRFVVSPNVEALLSAMEIVPMVRVN